MWGYFKAWAFKTYSIQALIDHLFYLRYLRYLVFGQKQNFLVANGNSHPKRVFRVMDSSLVSVQGIRKWKFPLRICMHNLGERTRQVWRDNSCRVRTHEKNSGDAVRWLGTIIQRFFVPNQEPTSVWIFWNGLVRVGTQGLFRPYLKTFVAPLLSTRLTAPGLNHADIPEESKHPVILPRKSHVTTLIIRLTHEQLGHAGRRHVH